MKGPRALIVTTFFIDLRSQCQVDLSGISGLLEVDPGFKTNSRLTLSLTLPLAAYGAPEQRESSFSALAQEVRSLHGVEAAGLAHRLLSGATTTWSAGAPSPALASPEQPAALRA